MNILCGTSPLSVPFINRQKLTGKISITAPFTIIGGAEIMSDIPLGGVVNIPAVQTENGLISLTAVHSETLSQSVAISSSLSGMNSPIESISVITANGISGNLPLKGEMSKLVKGSSEISTTIGEYSTRGELEIVNPLKPSGEAGCLGISLPQTTATVISDTLSVFADGYDVTSYLEDAEIKLFGENDPLTLKASFSPMIKVPKRIQININTESYYFEVDAFDQSNESLEITAIYSDTDKSSINIKNRRASKICADYSSVIFSANDFLVGNIEEDITDFELAKLLSTLSGTSARQLPDGRAMVFESQKSSSVYKPENILSWKKISKTPVSSVEVVYGKSGDNYITLEVESKATNGSTVLKVYSEDQPEIKADKGVLSLLSRGNCETITEEVVLTNGKGTISKPALFAISDEIKADGKTIYTSAQCQTVSVTYETIYDEYILSSDKEQNLTVCAYLENRAIIITGENGEDLSIDLPDICDEVTAYRAARSLFRSKSERSVIRTTHSNIINSTSGLKVKTPYCEGFLNSAKIIINTNPMKIIEELEVV